MTKLASLIARMEGYGIAGKIPTLRNNPGDLRHSPHSTHAEGAPDAVGSIDTPVHGWADLERQLALYAARGLTLQQMIEDYYAPHGENDSAGYLGFIAAGLGVAPNTPVSDCLEIQA